MNVTTLRESSSNDTGVARINAYTRCCGIKIDIMMWVSKVFDTH